MEIFIENAKVSDVDEWLKTIFQVDGSPLNAGKSEVLNIIYEEKNIPVIVTTGIECTVFTGIWFNSKILPWSSLEELVKFAASYFNSRIRYEKQELSPLFYEYFNGKITSIAW
jgi:hypothetical protein